MEEKFYSRKEVEASLWRVFAPFERNVKDINGIFKNRIKKLLDCDKAARDVAIKKNVRLDQLFVFSLGPTAPGKPTIYTELDAACLAIGIELTDLGKKQTEVVEMVRLARPYIAEYLRTMWTLPPLENIDPENPVTESVVHSRLPTCLRADAKGMGTDLRSFFIFKTTELSETHFESDNNDPAETKTLEPIVCKGLTELSNAINGFSLSDMRSFVVVEFGYLCSETVGIIRDAHAIKGRWSSKPVF